MIKVVDFGVGKLLDAESAASTATGMAVGSPAYMSPEQAHGDRGLDGRTDLWALGVLVFEMLTGTWPFRGQTPYEWSRRSSPRRFRDCRMRCPAWIHACPTWWLVALEHDVARRIATADEVLRALEAWVPRDAISSGRLLVAFPAPRPQVWLPRQQRGRWRIP